MLGGGGWNALVGVGGILGEWYWLCIYITTNLVENFTSMMQNGKGQKEGDGLAQNKKIFTTMGHNEISFSTLPPPGDILENLSSHHHHPPHHP
jgi:hypothetical protein